MKKILLAFLAISTLLASCNKSQDIHIDENKFGQIKIKFDHIVNSKKLTLNTTNYTNGSDESFNVTILKYYVSNIKLKKANGEVYTLPKEESYFLIDASNASSTQPTFEVPEGEYSELEFNLGVDSIVNHWPIEKRTGVLNVAEHDMYWSWNSGYIHFKIEGTSPQAPAPNHSYKFHIGFFGAMESNPVNNNRKVTLDLSQAGSSKVQENLSSDIHLMVDIGKIFDGVHKISIQEKAEVMHSGPHTKIADNYATMFIHDHTHNFQKIIK